MGFFNVLGSIAGLLSVTLGMKIYKLKKMGANMSSNNEITLIDDVNLCRAVRSFISKVDVTYDSDDFKKVIFDPINDDKFLLVTKRIGSKIAIADVKVVDDSLLNSML